MESHTTDHCGPRDLGHLWNSRLDYTGFIVLPQATSAQHGPGPGSFPSLTRAMSLVLTGLGENATTNNGELHFDNLRKRFKFPFLLGH